MPLALCSPLDLGITSSCMLYWNENGIVVGASLLVSSRPLNLATRPNPLSGIRGFYNLELSIELCISRMATSYSLVATLYRDSLYLRS